MSSKKSKHAFGSEANVDTAISNGTIDAYDVLFLDEGKIGWINKSGQKVILEDKKQVMTVSSLPGSGDTDVIYICNSKIHFWDGSKFVSPTSDGGLDEATVDQKVSDATDAANAYTDSKIESAMEVVEF